MPETGRIAILVIHGIGQQSPFDTLDSFARGFLKAAESYFGAENPADYKMAHRELPRRDPGAWESWQQYYLALDPGNAQASNAPSFDIFEYYWAYRMTGQATLRDIVDWLDRASHSAHKFYKPPDSGSGQSGRKPHANIPLPKDSPINRLLEPGTQNFHRNGYLRFIGYSVPVALRWMEGAFRWMEELSTSPLRHLPYAGWIISILAELHSHLLKKAMGVLIDYLGDVVVYTTTDRKAEHFVIRQKILRDSRLALEALLANPRYDRVLVAGHSLGSVIAYDTLNRMHKAPPLTEADGAKVDYKKLKGLITFGSPLDKIAFFFRDEIDDEQWVRAQIINNLHSFMRRETLFESQRGAVDLADETSANLKDVVWLNFYDYQDPISGHLDVYLAENKRVDTGLGFGAAHLGYWNCGAMYQQSLARFFSNP